MQRRTTTLLWEVSKATLKTFPPFLRMSTSLASRTPLDDLEELDLEPMTEVDGKARVKRQKVVPANALSATPPAMTERAHHIFFTVVLPVVFEWCALSDFFMPDELFHAYPEEKNGCVTTRGPFSVAHAVCKEWFVVLYKRILAHCLRADYDMRLLRNNTGGILKYNHAMVWGLSPTSRQRYLAQGGTPLDKAYNSGVELILTTRHVNLFEKRKLFLKHRGLQRLFASVMTGHTRMRASTMAQRVVREGLRRIKMRPAQIMNEDIYNMMMMAQVCRRKKKNSIWGEVSGYFCVVTRDGIFEDNKHQTTIR